jgi:hypothetical protein
MLKSRYSFARSTFLAIGMMAALAACSGPPAPVAYAPPAYTSPAPVTVATAAPSSSGSDMLIGGVAGAAAGYMLANAQHKAAPAPAAHSPTVVRQTVINKTVNVQQAAPAPAVKAVAPPAPPPKTMLASASPTPSYRASVTPIASTASYRVNTAPAVAMRSYTPSSSSFSSSRR